MAWGYVAWTADTSFTRTALRMPRLTVHLRASSIIVAVTLTIATASAQESPAQSGASQPSAAPAWVSIDGRPLFPVRGIPSYPAEKRADEVERRIVKAAEDVSVTPESVHTVRGETVHTAVVAGPREIVSALDVDAAAEGIHRDLLAESYARQVRSAIATYRYERSAQFLRAAAKQVALATAVFAVGLWLTVLLFRRLQQLAEERYKRHVHDIAIQSFQILGAGQIWSAVAALLRSLSWLAAAIVIYLYVEYVLSQFPWTRALGKRLLDLLVDPLSTMGRVTVAKLPDIIFLVLLYVIVRYALRFLRLFFDYVAKGTITFRSFYPDWAEPTYRGIRIVIILFAIVVAYPYIPGSQSEAFKGLSLLVGVMFSIGSSSFISNLIAGYALTYRRVFTTGEWVEIGETLGQVTQTRLQVTHLRSFKNEEVIVPNSLILTSPVTNYSKLAREQGLILHTTVGIGYETPWRQVEAMLLMAADRTPAVLREPRAFILQRALGDFSVTYELNAYCNDAGLKYRALTDLHRNILDVFNEYGVQIMTPAYEGDPENAKVVVRDQWFAAPALQSEPVAASRASAEGVGM